MTKSTAPAADLVPDDMNELRDADIPRVDLVGKAANGHRFILAKSAEEGGRGLFPKDMVSELVAKAKKDLDVTEALSDQGGAEALQPGSRDWEATDAATAQKWVAILQRAKYAAELLASREATEYALNGDPDDGDNEWTLEDVAWSLDSAIAALAAYAAGEAGEVALADDGVVKSVIGLDPMAVAQVELLVPLLKAGRVLSSSNEADLRDAAAKIQKVLAQLPAAPEAALEKEKAVDKDEKAASAAPQAAAGAEAQSAAPSVQKATLVAVYTQDGKLIGAVDPGDLTELSTGMPADGGEGSDGGESAEGAAEQVSADTPSVDGGENATVVPGTSTVQSPKVDDGDVTKAIKDAVTTVLKEVFTPFAEAVQAEVQKATAGQSELADVVKALGNRVDNFGLQPDDRRSPALNGATGEAGLAVRGAGAAPDFAVEDEALAKSIAEAKTPDQIIAARQNAAFAKLSRIFV